MHRFEGLTQKGWNHFETLSLYFRGWSFLVTPRLCLDPPSLLHVHPLALSVGTASGSSSLDVMSSLDVRCLIKIDKINLHSGSNNGSVWHDGFLVSVGCI